MNKQKVSVVLIVLFFLLIILVSVKNQKNNLDLPKDAYNIGGGYNRSSKGIYLETGQKEGFSFVSPTYKVYRIDDADIETFSYIGGNYGKDKNNGFYGNKLFKSDPGSLSNIGLYYAKDKDKIYFHDAVIEGAELSTFEIIPSYADSYSKDSSHVWYNGEVLEKSDPGTFELLFKDALGFSKYSRDKNNIYFVGKLLDLDAKTFELVANQKGDSFVKDKNGVYCFEHIPQAPFVKRLKIGESNSNEFILLNEAYSKDKQHVYYSNCKTQGFYTKIIEGADVSSFEAIDEYSGKDKNYFYKADKRVQ